MRPLSIFNGDPATSLYGTMLFPDSEEKARAAAAWVLSSGPLRQYCAEHGSPGKEFWLPLTSDSLGGVSQEELRKKEYIGLVTGEVVKVLWALICDDPKTASINKAILIVENDVVKDSKGGLGRASMHRYLAEMEPVLHFWGTASIRHSLHGKRWLANPANNYDAVSDVGCFLMEAEILYQQLTKWSAGNKNRSKHFSSIRFTAPVGWEPRPRPSEWQTSVLYPIALPADLVPFNRRRGRPAGKPVSAR